MLRVLVLLLLGAALGSACDCEIPTVRQARKHAEIVFRGRIVGFRDTGTGYEYVIFEVDRVWKGVVSRRFEMPALKEEAACLGFWPNFLKMGNQLLVYAFKLGTQEYLTDICTRTNLVENSKDFAELGPGHKPVDKIAR